MTAEPTPYSELFAETAQWQSEDAAWVATAEWGLEEEWPEDQEADAGDMSSAAAHVFTRGQCHALAFALSHLLNAPIISSLDREHMAVIVADDVTGEQLILDINGLSSIDEWVDEWMPNATREGIEAQTLVDEALARMEAGIEYGGTGWDNDRWWVAVSRDIDGLFEAAEDDGYCHPDVDVATAYAGLLARKVAVRGWGEPGRVAAA